MISHNNPFAYGKIVKGQQFFNRKKERAELAVDIYNHQNVILYAPRRYGKTSLILTIFKDIKKKNKNFVGIYIDFYRVNSINDFLNLMSQQYALSSGMSLEKILTSLKNIIRGITPNITLDDSSKPKIELSVSPKSSQYAFEDVMKLPEKIAKKGKLVAVFFDEFQEAANLNSFDFQKQIRAFIQHQTNVSYIFCGSKQHLFQNIFSNSNNPLFKIGKTKYLNVIPENEYVKFIYKHFIKINEKFSKETAVRLYKLAGSVPYNIQLLCHHLYDLMLIRQSESIEKLIDLTFINIAEQKNEEFIFIYDSLNVSSRRALEVIIKYNGENLFRKEILSEFLIAPSTLKKAINSLITKGILDKEQQAYLFQDVFFKRWLVKRM